MPDTIDHKNSQQYYEAIDPLDGMPTEADFFRFKCVKKLIHGSSVLDIACGQADFLNAIKQEYQIAGTEINKVRIDYCNKALGFNAVKYGNLDTKLDFENNSFDTVTCMEVLEHLRYPLKALKELIRISRKRIIITVPFNEKITNVLCIHCAKYTPRSGHLHSFNKKSIRNIIPDDAHIVKVELCANKLLKTVPYFNRLICKAPYCLTSIIDNISNIILPKATWMIVLIEKNKLVDNHH